MGNMKVKCPKEVVFDSDDKRDVLKHDLKLVALEITRKCNLSCVHCRASAKNVEYKGELSTTKIIELLDNISLLGKPIIILTGGEPLLREDIFDIASHGNKLGLKMVMAPNGTLITKEVATKIINSGIKRISISLDGSDKNSHDKFRGIKGAFDGAIQGINYVKEIGIPFQINTTITKANLEQLPLILDLAKSLGAIAHHIFLLVPTGRGKYIIDDSISANDYEKTLNWFYSNRKNTDLQLKATCAPHYHRILRQRAKIEGRVVSFEKDGLDALTRGCLAGISFCFISYEGIIQPCGYANINCGSIINESFNHIWEESKVFKRMRNLNELKGKCGICKYVRVCGGCRARGFESTGDYMSEEPLCSFNPR